VHQEAERRAGGDAGEHGRRRAVQMPGVVQVDRDHGQRERDDRAHPRGQAVDPVGEVDDVHERHETHGRDRRAGVGKVQLAEERQRYQVHDDAEVHCDERRRDLSSQLEHGRQLEAIVERPHRGDERRRQQDPVPLPAFRTRRGQPDHPRHERPAEDRQPPQQWRRPIRQPALAWPVDRPHRPGQAHRQRRQQRGHGGRNQEGVEHVELSQMRHHTVLSIAGAGVSCDGRIA
jgi:hypothetical protein